MSKIRRIVRATIRGSFGVRVLGWMMVGAGVLGCGGLDGESSDGAESVVEAEADGGSEAASAVIVGGVVISEIMYHPVLENSDTDTHEFVEIFNRSEVPVALAGWQLAGDIAFTFP